MMRARVKAAHGIELRTEVQVVGEDASATHANSKAEYMLRDVGWPVGRAGLAALRRVAVTRALRSLGHTVHGNLIPRALTQGARRHGSGFSRPARHLRRRRWCAKPFGRTGRALHRLRGRREPHCFRQGPGEEAMYCGLAFPRLASPSWKRRNPKCRPAGLTPGVVLKPVRQGSLRASVSNL